MFPLCKFPRIQRLIFPVPGICVKPVLVNLATYQHRICPDTSVPCIPNALQHTQSHVIRILRHFTLDIHHPIRKSEDAVIFLNHTAFTTKIAWQPSIGDLSVIARHNGTASFVFRSKLGVYPGQITDHKDRIYLNRREGLTFAIARNSDRAVIIIGRGMI